MKVGLTYDLRSEYLAAGYGEEETAEFDRAETIDGIEGALRELGHDTDRIGHARQLVRRLARGDSWDLVFNICEGLNGLGRESQVPAILELYGIAYTFSDALIMALSLHKGHTKSVVRAAGIPTPEFLVVHSLSDLDGSWKTFPAFAKPVAEGTGKGITPASKIRDTNELQSVCARLLERFQQPVLVEAFLPGREFTVGLVGTGDAARVLGTMEIILRSTAEPEVYSYLNKENSEEFVDYRHYRGGTDPEVVAAERIALRSWHALGGRDAGRVDLRSDSAGGPQFLEINPLAGLHEFHSDLPMIAAAQGTTYKDLIRGIVESASQRIGQFKKADLK